MKTFIYFTFWLLLYISIDLEIVETTALAFVCIFLTLGDQFSVLESYLKKEAKLIDKVQNPYNK